MRTSGLRPQGLRHLDHRPHLDGLRAVAVYLVVAFHSGLGLLSGGFIGVDVFFVLSGYLVTQLLLRDIASHDRIRLRRFYARRYRRLLPAAFVTLVATAIAFAVVASAAEVADSVGAFRASFLYFANWHFIGQSANYFAADIDRSPVIHFWSLAVEEQFYLLWPLVLGGMVATTGRLGAKRMTAVRWMVAAAAAASVIAALRLSGSDLDRAYYGSDTRAYQLLAGALLALSPRLFVLSGRARHGATLLAALAAGSIAVLSTSALGLATIDRGVATTVATCGLIVAIESSPLGAVTRALSQPLMTYLGRLSYGIYLWHWPVIVVLAREASPSPVELFSASCLLATSLAALSYHALELRVRLSGLLDRFSTQVIGAGLALSLVGGLVIVPAILDAKLASALRVAGGEGVDVKTLDWRTAKDDVPPMPECSLDATETCTTVKGSQAHVLLLGDSNARMYIPTFTGIAEQRNLTLSIAVAPLCPWQLDLYYLRGADACEATQADWYGGLLEKLDPDVIVVAGRPIDDPASAADIVTPRGWMKPDSDGFSAALLEVSARSLDRLRSGGRKVVVVEPIPIATTEDDPLSCLSSATSLEQCVYEANRTRTPLEVYFADAVVSGEVWSLDVDRLICPRLPACDPVVDGTIVKRDSNHITGAFARQIGKGMDALLRRTGVLP